MATFRIKHLLDDDRITTCNNDFEFIQFVNLIQSENDDELTYDVDSGIDYINLTCDNLDFAGEEDEEEKEEEEEEYEFSHDEKHSIWYRSEISVTAKTYEDAIKKVHQMYLEDTLPNKNWEIMYDTVQTMSPEENKGASTIEIMNDKGEVIISNGE